MMRKLCMLVCLQAVLAVAGLSLIAQPAEPSFNSPYQTVYTHLHYLQEDSYAPAKAALAFQKEGRTQEENEMLAIQLKQILDGRGVYIEMEKLPRDPDYYDSTSQHHQYALTSEFPGLYVVKTENGSWKFSEGTAARIPELHKEVFPFGTHRLLNLLPKIGQRTFFGLHLWQYATILILILLAVLLHKLISLLFRNVLHTLLHSLGYRDIADKFINPVARPLSLLLIFAVLLALAPIVQLPPASGYWVFLILKASLPFFATVVAYRLVDLVGVYMERFASKTENSLDDQLVPLIRKALRTFVVILGAIFILDNLNFDITAFIAGISIGGLAFALAAQDTIKNFFGSLMIFIDKPFQIGDWITAGEIDGTVEEVGFRSTRVRTFRNSVTSVPNGRLADMIIDNHGLRVYRRFFTTLQLTYDTPTDRLQLFVDGLKKLVEQHPHTRKDYYEVHLNDLGAHSLNIMFYIFFSVPSWSDELKARHEILMRIIELARTLEVNFAFPTQTLQVETLPGQPSLMPAYTEPTEEMKQRMEKMLASGSYGV